MFGLDKEAVLYQEAVYVTSPTSCKGDVTNHHQRFESPCSGGVARNRMARDYLQPFSPYGRYYLKVTAQLGSSECFSVLQQPSPIQPLLELLTHPKRHSGKNLGTRLLLCGAPLLCALRKSVFRLTMHSLYALDLPRVHVLYPCLAALVDEKEMGLHVNGWRCEKHM
ncbi:hypothetical protein CEXT_794441 [Caerostris extrusa]|uniref:Uncharacterized protein n=1 Tax=Caerostris extrusa TaxID=172846 RepID=A0AAV4YAP0_CAEEX|nr:hypothetical protein CEXT_794441 [Caerostris extrusa]